MTDPHIPKITTYRKPTGVVHVNVFWRETKARRRPALGRIDDADVPRALEIWKAEALPALIEWHRAEYAAALEALEYTAPNRIPGKRLDDLRNWYLGPHAAGRLKPGSIEKYSRVIDRFIAYCSTRRVGRLNQLSLRLVDDWRVDTAEAVAKEEKTQWGNARIIRAWLNAAVANGVIPASPIERWSIPKGKKKRKRALTRAELAQLLQGYRAHCHPAVALLAEGLAVLGWRISDFVDFRLGEMDLQTEEIDRENIKIDGEIKYPITPHVRAVLERALAIPGRPMTPASHVFLNTEGRPWTKNSAEKALRRGAQRFRFRREVSPHLFRCTFGTHLINGDPEAGIAPVPAKVVQFLMAHTDIKTTLTYYQDVTIDDMRRWHTAAAGNLTIPPPAGLSLSPSSKGQQKTRPA